MKNLIQVPTDFVIDALQARYDAVENRWGNEASEALWSQVLQLVEECGLSEDVTSPSLYVDNYLINGDFVSRDDEDCWLDKTTFNDYVNYHNLNKDEITSLKDSPMFGEFWYEFCQDNALVYNEEHACLGF